MASDDARILVIGAGVNGSVCSARLFERGVDVTVLARGQRLAEIESNGIVIENPLSRKRTFTKVRVTRELAPADTYEYIASCAATRWPNCCPRWPPTARSTSFS